VYFPWPPLEATLSIKQNIFGGEINKNKHDCHQFPKRNISMNVCFEKIHSVVQ
jgi:hypothetical protein